MTWPNLTIGAPAAMGTIAILCPLGIRASAVTPKTAAPFSMRSTATTRLSDALRRTTLGSAGGTGLMFMRDQKPVDFAGPHCNMLVWNWKQKLIHFWTGYEIPGAAQRRGYSRYSRKRSFRWSCLLERP